MLNNTYGEKTTCIKGTVSVVLCDPSSKDANALKSLA